LAHNATLRLNHLNVNRQALLHGRQIGHFIEHRRLVELGDLGRRFFLGRGFARFNRPAFFGRFFGRRFFRGRLLGRRFLRRWLFGRLLGRWRAATGNDDHCQYHK
jgi:hypothetical protein